MLTHEALITVVHAFVGSRLDYCNSVLLGISDKHIQKLQRIQNIAARLVSGSSKYDHITPVLKELHWLPIKERIQFKTLVITFKALNGQAPEYLSELLCRKVNTRLLRSSNGPRCRGVLFVFYLPKGLLVSLERSVSLVCGNAFLTKIPWCITSQSLLKVGSRQTRYGEKLCVFGDFVIFGHFNLSVKNL